MRKKITTNIILLFLIKFIEFILIFHRYRLNEVLPINALITIRKHR